MSRLWGETVTGTAWTADGSPTFDQALNAYLQRIDMEGGVVTTIQYTAFLGDSSIVIHSALVVYTADGQVSYEAALDALIDGITDDEAGVGFYQPEDLTEVMNNLEDEDEA